MTPVHCAVSLSADLVSAKGMIMTDANPPLVCLPPSVNIGWSDTLPPGKYVFACQIRAKAGATVTATVINASPGAPTDPLGTDSVTLDGPQGTVPVGEATVHFEVG